MNAKEMVDRATTFDCPPRLPINYHNGDFAYPDTANASRNPISTQPESVLTGRTLEEIAQQ